MKPTCFKGFSEKSDYCKKVCKHLAECSGGKYASTPTAIDSLEYNRGLISFRQLAKKWADRMDRKIKNLSTASTIDTN